MTEEEQDVLIEALREAMRQPRVEPTVLAERDFEEPPFHFVISEAVLDVARTGAGYCRVPCHGVTLDQYGTIMLIGKTYTPPLPEDRVLQQLSEAVCWSLCEAVRKTFGEVRDTLWPGAQEKGGE